jgi:hypothetical protein
MAEVGRVTKITVNKNTGQAIIGIPADIARAMEKMDAHYLHWQLQANGLIYLQILGIPDDKDIEAPTVSVAEWAEQA